MNIRLLLSWILCLTLLGPSGGRAAAAVPLPAEPLPTAVPTWDTTHHFSARERPSDRLLVGIRNSEQLEFQLRHDRLATLATLHLDYTPSPALLPVLSHLRIYLNDEMMGTLPITQAQLGQRVQQTLPLDPTLLGDFNRVRLEFIGHYSDVCEDPAHSGLWLNVSRQSRVSLREQALDIANDLAYFPLPFFDERDDAQLVLPMVLANNPTLGEQRAAAILASYFGMRAAWRGARFPVGFEHLPAAAGQPRSAVVFASNARRPAFLAAHPDVNGPVVELIDHPGGGYAKLLLVLGRDEDDLVQAASALALGDTLFRGERVEVHGVQTLRPRQPYDAPNWIRTDRPVRFAELLDYPQQLQVSGLQPPPVTLDVRLPPDLFVWRSQGIPMHTRYRFTPPAATDESRLNISLNDQYVGSVPLSGNGRPDSAVEKLRLAVSASDATARSEELSLPALKIGERNTLRFEFNFASKLGNAQRDQCQTYLPTTVQAAIDDTSTLDLSGYHHYMAMPDIRAFARSGYPFSRLADLSETLILMPPQSDEVQIGTLLETVAGIAAQVGYPALGVRLSNSWQDASRTDADLLILGPMPKQLHDAAGLNLLLDQSRQWLRQAGGKRQRDPSTAVQDLEAHRLVPASRVELSAPAPIAAIAGMQSPFHEQRSIVALLASQPEDYQLLRDALGDPGKREAIAGSVALIRSSGVDSHFVGERYYVGSLPWWQLLWFHLSAYPTLLAALTALCAVLLAFLLWRVLRWTARQRLGKEPR